MKITINILLAIVVSLSFISKICAIDDANIIFPYDGENIIYKDDDDKVYNNWFSNKLCGPYVKRIDLEYGFILEFYSPIDGRLLKFPILNRKRNEFTTKDNKYLYTYDLQKNILLENNLISNREKVLYICPENRIPDTYKNAYKKHINKLTDIHKYLKNNSKNTNHGEYLSSECQLFYYKELFNKAWKACRESVSFDNNPKANFYLAALYQWQSKEMTELKNKYINAYKHMKIAAEKGIDEAFGWLAWHYRGGHGIYRDHEAAFYWYKVSANSDNEGSWSVAQMYADGLGVELDFNESFRWLYLYTWRNRVHITLW